MPAKKTAAAKTSKASRPPASNAVRSSKKSAPDWTERLKESSHDILLAGLASLARARASDKDKKKGGKADFETLVAEGRKLEPELKESMQKTWTELREKSRSKMSFKSDGKLQEVLEERVVAALARLGVPSRKEIQALTEKVDRLSAARSGVRRSAAKKAVAATPRRRTGTAAK